MKKTVFLCALVPLLLLACASFGGQPQKQPKWVYLEVAAGTVSVKATGLMHRGLEYQPFDTKGDFNESAFDRVALVDREALRLNATMVLSANERFDYYLEDSEVITFEIDAVGEGDAEVVLHDGGATKRYAVKSGARFGLMISCRN